MDIEGTVADVMETWPLQLALDSAESRIHILLDMETTVTLAGETVGMDRIRPGQRIRVQGRRIDESNAKANTIEVLDES